jgi:hypothetical protein
MPASRIQEWPETDFPQSMKWPDRLSVADFVLWANNETAKVRKSDMTNVAVTHAVGDRES